MVEAKKKVLCPNKKEDREEIQRIREQIRKIVSDFMDGKNRSQILLVSLQEVAEDISREAIACKVRKGKVHPTRISFTKIRKYYEQFLDVYERCTLKNEENEFSEAILLQVYMVKSYLAYDRARKKINLSFEEFLSGVLSKISDKETLESGKLLFEALIGYIRAYLD